MLKRLQKEQRLWIEHNFKDHPNWMFLLGVMEELGELVHAHLKYAQGIRIEEPHHENKKDAIGDIVIFLSGYCTAEGIDFEKTVQKTWDKVKQRDWKINPKNGEK